MKLKKTLISKATSKLVICAVAVMSLTSTAFAVEQTLIKNVKVWDGTSKNLSKTQDVLIEGELIKSIGKGLKVAADVEVIDGQGKTMIPGLSICILTYVFKKGC